MDDTPDQNDIVTALKLMYAELVKRAYSGATPDPPPTIMSTAEYKYWLDHIDDAPLWLRIQLQPDKYKE